MVFNPLVILMISLTHAQFFTTSEKKGVKCPSLKNIETDQITECILLCRGVENTTSFYDEPNKNCQCVAKSCLTTQEKSEGDNAIASVEYLYQGEKLGYFSSEEDAFINFRFDNGATMNTGTGKNEIEITYATTGDLVPNFNGGFMTTRYSNENTYGPMFTGWEKVSCLREDMFGDQCKSNGITFALRVRASNTTSTRKDVIFITPHAGTDIGYRVVYTTNGDIVLGIWANTFHLTCQVPMATKEIYKWHHYVIAIRIQPFLKMLCYDNGLVIGEKEDSRPVPGGDKVVKIFIGWRFSSTSVYPKYAIDIDDVALWERYVERNEVKRIYQMTKVNTVESP